MAATATSTARGTRAGQTLGEEVEAARDAGLRYVTDDRPGITRRRAGKGFSYRNAHGERITDKSQLTRIRAIAVPPAWTSVWICPNPRGHIQATGRDVRGRKQYRYHPDWRSLRDASKFDRVLSFGRALPVLRQRVESDMALSGAARERILATVVWLIDETLMRVGNEEYARSNDSYGATTLRNEHADVTGAEVTLSYRGKAGKEHQTSFRDRRVAAVIRRCQELPGESLFSYLDDEGDVRQIDSGDVNDYLHEIAGDSFTVKDFRTFGGTALCYQMLCDAGPAETKAEATTVMTGVIKLVAARLGNTPAVCRGSYLHPAVLDSYAEGTLTASKRIVATDGLQRQESQLLRFLEPLDALRDSEAVGASSSAGSG